MNLTRNLAFIDIESTGLDPATDRIVELAIVILRVDGTTMERCLRMNPGVPIPPEATAVHGITDADVAYKPRFEQYALALKCLLEDCDLAGFNCLNYDVPLLWEEFFRAGIEWDLSGKQIIDVGNIFKKKEQRTLGAAVEFYSKRDQWLVNGYTLLRRQYLEVMEAHGIAPPVEIPTAEQLLGGRTHEGAHGALADTLATLEVFQGQLARYTDLAEMPVEQLAEFSRMEEHKRLDLAGKLVVDSDGDAVYNIGNKKGTKVRVDESFARWMLGKDFTANTKFAIEAELERLHESYRAEATAK